MADLRYAILRNTARARRKLLGLKSGFEAAEEMTVVHAADSVETSEAIALPGEIERATASVPSSDMATQRKWAAAGTLGHGPTRLYRLRNAFVAGDNVYTSRSLDRHGRIEAARVSANTLPVETGLLCESGGSTFFGHWLCDNLCTELLSADLGMTPLSLPAHWMHEAGYRAITGLQVTHAPVIAVGDLWLADDRGYNAGRIRRFGNLRNLVRHSRDDTKSNLVYIARGSTGASRNLVNDQQVRQVLQRNGFTILEPERSSPAEIVDALANARLAISVEGSAICHALSALPPGAGIVIIQPPDHFNIFNKIIGDFAQLRTGFVVAEPSTDGFTLDENRLLKTIDLVLKHAP